MLKENMDELDIQNSTENVSFLADCFDKSFNLQSSLNYVKDYIATTKNEQNVSKEQACLLRKKSFFAQEKQINKSISNLDVLTQLNENKTYKKNLKNWGLPSQIADRYKQKGIVEMFDWQVDCLSNPKVLIDCQNLVYSAPTSAGKTLVADILTIKAVLERQKKVIIILPFVSIVREKLFYLQDILSTSGVRVEGFMGSQSPPGGLQSVHIAICTIEKANSLINKLLDEGSISELGAVIVDELHLLGDPHRGYILELLLTKIKYISSKTADIKIQIVGMSATLPNLETLASWLQAELFITEFRPIPLDEYCLVGSKYYDKSGNYKGPFKNTKSLTEEDYVLSLCLDTIKEGCSILIFCMTKNRCENLAQNISSSFFKIGCTSNDLGKLLREQLKPESILEVLEQLKNCPVGLDNILKKLISFGVAYHHAGLTFDERDIIEGAFKSGAIRVLVATSTLSSGVNLPARKVIVRSPVFQKQPINILTYKQMIGRAGRMGKDVKGESILICTSAEQKIGFGLMMGNLEPVKSCIESEDKFMRTTLEMIASQGSCTKSDLELYTKCTLLFTQQTDKPLTKSLLNKTLEELINFELIRIQGDDDQNRYVATSLGKACLSSSMAPNDGLSLFCELQKARQCLVLETDLHLIYLVTPYSVSNQWNNIDWLHLLNLWESLTPAMKRVGDLVGVRESFIIRCLRGSSNKGNDKENKLDIHKRFYTALALQDLVNEVSLSEVACKFQCARGFLQGLQQSSSTFAGMVTAFCHQLGWRNMELLISQFQDRLQFGIHSELLELMKLSSLNGVRARTLFDAGFETISSIASAEVNTVETLLLKSVPFQSEKEREGEDKLDVRKRNKMKNIWITGCCGLTTKEAAENLVLEARKYLTEEIGVAEIKWKDIKLNETSVNPVIDKDKKNILVQNGNNESETTNNIESNEENINQNIRCNISCKIFNETKQIKDIKNNNLTPNPDPSIQICNKKEEVYSNKESEDLNKIHTVSPIKQKICNEKSFYDCNKNKEVTIKNLNENTNSEFLLSLQKEDVVWESLSFNEAGFSNITKYRTSDIFFSPNISFGDASDNFECNDKNVTSNTNICIDVSLFSSEGENSSVFDDSLPIDLLPKSLIKHTKTKDEIKNVETSTDYLDINSKTLLNAFKSSVIEIDDDEDIKLVYDDEKKNSEENFNSGTDYYSNEIMSQNEIINTQYNEVTNYSFVTPLKRHAENKYWSSSSKKAKRMSQIEIGSQKSEHVTLKFKEYFTDCYILREDDIINNFSFIENSNLKQASILFETNKKNIKPSDAIGNNILKIMIDVSDNEDHPHIQGIAFCLKNDICVYLDLTSLGKLQTVFKLSLGKFIGNPLLKLIMVSSKSNFTHIKRWLGRDITSECVDITLIEWLLDTDDKISNINELALKYLDLDLANIQITTGHKMKTYNMLDVNERACLKAWCIEAIAEKQKTNTYQFIRNCIDIEMHVCKILGKCEFYGIAVDKGLASKLLLDVKKSQEILQKKAFKLCGYHFNFNSSKEVAKVLGLYKGRKISTKKSVLSAHNSPMASIVIYWRKLNSILTKTLYPLTEQAFTYSIDNRISPVYTMYTCTGRISMHEPNLQNVPRTFCIPIKYLSTKDFEPSDDVVEFNCRNIFKPAPGYVFVSADYCQLEMRILTHYSKDAVLSKIMRANVDVFKSIAAALAGVSDENVDDDLRQKAKQLCYGILYGMGNRTLAQHLDVNEAEAAVFMDTFYKTYPALKSFTQSVVEECRKKGYVETLMKRRRYLPDINSKIPSKRSAAERQAVNTTIQGSAADIAKAAMCAIDNETKLDVDQPRLILQMHDELIYEVKESQKNSFSKILKDLMQETVQLNVPLPVKVKNGSTWGAMEEVKLENHDISVKI